jgi:hypothetical protein
MKQNKLEAALESRDGCRVKSSAVDEEDIIFLLLSRNFPLRDHTLAIKLPDGMLDILMNGEEETATVL